MNLLLLLLLLQEPTPAPVPPDVEAKAVISDRHGAPLPTRVVANSWLVVSAEQSVYGSKPSSIRWSLSPKSIEDRSVCERVQKDDGTIVPMYFIAVDESVTELTIELSCAKGDTQDSRRITIQVYGGNTDPRPPPGPTPGPNPEPGPKPGPQPQPVASSVSVWLCYDPGKLAPEHVAVTDATRWWMSLKHRGHNWQFFPLGDDSEIGTWAWQQAKAKGVAQPCLVIVNQDRELIDVYSLPRSVQEVDALIKKLTGGK